MLRKDISSLVGSFGDTATDEVKTRGDVPAPLWGV
jgi:hypothetical protein